MSKLDLNRYHSLSDRVGVLEPYRSRLIHPADGYPSVVYDTAAQSPSTSDHRQRRHMDQSNDSEV